MRGKQGPRQRARPWGGSEESAGKEGPGLAVGPELCLSSVVGYPSSAPMRIGKANLSMDSPLPHLGCGLRASEPSRPGPGRAQTLS